MDWLYGYVEGTFLLQGLADVDLQLFLWSLYAPHLISVQGNWSRNSSLPPKVVLQCYTLYSKTHGFFVSYTMVYGPTAVGSTTSRGLRKGYFETKPSGIAVYRKGNIEHNSVSRHRMKVFNSASRSSTYWICCLLRSDKRAEIELAGYTSFLFSRVERFRRTALCGWEFNQILSHSTSDPDTWPLPLLRKYCPIRLRARRRFGPLPSEQAQSSPPDCVASLC